MSQKLTLSIPDELAERLEPYRDQLNLSAICARALERAVTVLEHKPEPSGKHAELIVRLRKEKMEAEDKDYNFGFDFGVDTAKYLTYRELVECERAINNESPIPERLEDWLDDVLYERADVISRRERFEEGALAGIMAIWERIKDEL